MAGVSDRQLAQGLRSDVLHLIVLPTEECNLRCTYCYETFPMGGMRAEVEGGLIAFLDRRLPELRTLEVSWFGGEPMVAYRSVVRVMRHVIAHAPATLRVRSDMTTNGYLLTPARLHELVGLGVTRYQITLDGRRATHDQRRRRRDGAGTFDTIWQHLEAARALDEDFEITLRLHVSPDNVREMESLVDDVAATFGSDGRFRVMFRSLAPWAGESRGFVYFTKDRAGAALDRLRARAEAAGLRGEPAAGATVCYATKPNSLLIRADGRIGKCTLALDADANTIGTLAPSGTIDVDSEARAVGAGLAHAGYRRGRVSVANHEAVTG